MKVLNKVVIGAAALVLLTACGPSKTTYAKFHEQAAKAAEKAKEATFSKVVLSGSAKDDEGKTQKFDNITIKFEKGTFTATNITHLDEVAAALLLNGVQAVGVPEEKDTTYYAGNGFKVEYKAEDGKKTATWNAQGLLTSTVDGDAKLTVKYSK